MGFLQELKETIKDITDFEDKIDTDTAAKYIRDNIFFRGPNVWILAFSIVIASVGLNINSTAVIIGAMLISPLMGPIIGVGLALGINDTLLMKKALKNLLVMVLISIIASLLFFMISPLELVNPTELEARTNPTIYDVLIALFGGFAGILEISRKAKGTVISGVAIATALMPPLCTAGYGLAHFDISYFLGAMFLFSINCVFIIFATYLACKYLGYREFVFQNEGAAKKTRHFIAFVIVALMIPSIWSAIVMIRDNRFSKQAALFVSENKTLSHSYIYDYKIDRKDNGKLILYLAGENLSDKEKIQLLSEANKLGIHSEQIEFKQHKYAEKTDKTSEELLKGIFDRNDEILKKKEDEIEALKEQLAAFKKNEIPYIQIYKEIQSQYPQINNIYITTGANIQNDSLFHKGVIIYTKTAEKLKLDEYDKLSKWLKLRLNDSTAVLINEKEN